MSLFDFLFPEWAEASHLRSLAETSERRERREAFSQHRDRQRRHLAGKSTDRKIEILERELAEASLVIEALIEVLEADGKTTRADLAQRIRQIDARDGVADGKLTPASEQPFRSNRKWDDETDPS